GKRAGACGRLHRSYRTVGGPDVDRRDQGPIGLPLSAQLRFARAVQDRRWQDCRGRGGVCDRALQHAFCLVERAFPPPELAPLREATMLDGAASRSTLYLALLA